MMNIGQQGTSALRAADGGYIGPGYRDEEGEQRPPQDVAAARPQGVNNNNVGYAPDGIQHISSVTVSVDRGNDLNDLIDRVKKVSFDRQRSGDGTRVALLSGLSDHAGEESWQLTWTTGVPLIISYFLAVVSFIVFFHLDEPLLPKLGYPAQGNLQDRDRDPDALPEVWWKNGAVLVLVMWSVIHTRKFLLIVLALVLARQPYTTPVKNREPGTRGVGVVLSILMVLFAIVSGGWTGWASNIYSGYMISDCEYVIAGLVVFVLAEAGNTTLTLVCLTKRLQRDNRYRTGKNVLELLSWVGFCVTTLLLPAFVVLAVRLLVTLVLIRWRIRPTCC